MKVAFKQLGSKPNMSIDLSNQGAVPLSICGGCLVVDPQQDEVTVGVGNRNYKVVGETQTIILPVISAESGKYAVNISTKNGRYDEISFTNNPDLRPHKKLLTAVVDFRRRLHDVADESMHVSYNAMIGLPMFAPLITKTGIDSEWMLNEIEEALPHLSAVCTRPRQHLRVEESVRPVHVVQRIGPEALQHLASHSEHWMARTITGLKPSHLLARVTEDDLGLYENRFVKFLIDTLLERIAHHLRETNEVLRSMETAIDWEEVANDFFDIGYTRLQDMLVGVIGNVQLEHGTFQKLKVRLDLIRHRLLLCKESRFYAKLSKSQVIHPPIRPTNILSMDSNYGPLYRLWLKINANENEAEDAIDGMMPDDLDRSYSDYCQAAVVAAMAYDGFEPNDDSVGVFQDGSLRISASLRKGPWTIVVRYLTGGPSDCIVRVSGTMDLNKVYSITENIVLPTQEELQGLEASIRDCIEIEQQNLVIRAKPTPEQKMKIASLLQVSSVGVPSDRRNTAEWKYKIQRGRDWSRFFQDVYNKIPQPECFTVDLMPVLSRLGEHPSQVEGNTAQLLSVAVANTHDEPINSTLVLLPYSVSDVPEATPYSVVRRIINYGDNFCHQDAKVWGNREAGMIPISPHQAKSLYRITRLIRTYMLDVEIKSKRVGCCPVCKAPANNEAIGCNVCGAIWGETACKYHDCGHCYVWIRPTLGNKSRNPEVGNAITRIDKMENRSISATITGFCESPEAGLSQYPICPKCGRCQAEDKFINCCQRCASST